MQDVAEHLVSKAVGDARRKGVEPIGRPTSGLVLEEGKPLTFKASFDVVPRLRRISTIEATEPSRAIG
jgi:FKBP-type peptidyl-prolyl cis-trans isomerase (trigger factor)